MPPGYARGSYVLSRKAGSRQKRCVEKEDPLSQAICSFPMFDSQVASTDWRACPGLSHGGNPPQLQVHLQKIPGTFLTQPLARRCCYLQCPLLCDLLQIFGRRTDIILGGQQNPLCPQSYMHKSPHEEVDAGVHGETFLWCSLQPRGPAKPLAQGGHVRLLTPKRCGLTGPGQGDTNT